MPPLPELDDAVDAPPPSSDELEQASGNSAARATQVIRVARVRLMAPSVPHPTAAGASSGQADGPCVFNRPAHHLFEVDVVATTA